MNVFSRIKHAVIGVLGGKVTKYTRNVPDVQETRSGKLRFPKTGRRLFRFIPSGKRGIRGPVFLPTRENHHASRQTCRAYLRALFFGQYSAQYPLASRRQRRRIARLATHFEYQRMMNDITNRIPDDDPAVAKAATA